MIRDGNVTIFNGILMPLCEFCVGDVLACGLSEVVDIRCMASDTLVTDVVRSISSCSVH